MIYCHNPNNNPKPCKIIFVGVVSLSVRKNHHTTPNHHVITFKTVRSKLGSWFSVCNLNITQQEKIWKTTSTFLKIEEDLNIFENGRLPQYFWKYKTTSIVLKMEVNLNIYQMQDDLNFDKWPYIFSNRW